MFANTETLLMLYCTISPEATNSDFETLVVIENSKSELIFMKSSYSQYYKKMTLISELCKAANCIQLVTLKIYAKVQLHIDYKGNV